MSSNRQGVSLFSTSGQNVKLIFQDGRFWRVLYVRQTDDFSSRLPSHEKWGVAIRRGATHIHTLVVQSVDLL